jgi:hypothetical protein
MAEKLFKQSAPKPPPVQGGWNNNDSFGVKVEKMLTRWVQNLFVWGAEWGAEMLVQIFDASMKILKPGMMRMFMPYLKKITSTQGIPQDIKDMVNRVEQEEGEAGAVGVGALVVIIIYQVVQAALAPVSNLVTQATNKVIPNALIPPTMAGVLYLRGRLSEAEYEQVMKSNGWDERGMRENLAFVEQLPSIYEGLEFYRRGEWNEQDFLYHAKQLGISASNAIAYEKLSKQIPGISDLIRFMVRDAFNDGASSRFGYDDDYPSEIDKYLPVLGFDKDWGKRFWRAHWQLPSPSMGYEMLHRGIIDIDTLDELLKISDYPSYWREKLIKMSYNNLTRVDLRRLLQAGMIDRDKAKKTYLAMGYNDEDAELLTDFALKGISNDERDLTKSEIVGMYVDGLMDGGDVRASLVKMGYDTQEADQILKQADFDIAKAARVDEVNYAREMFMADKMSRAEAQGKLANAGLKGNAIDRHLLAWERAKESDVKGLSLADMRRMYPKKLITEAEFRDALKKMKYDQKSIDLLVKEANQDMEESAEE